MLPKREVLHKLLSLLRDEVPLNEESTTWDPFERGV